MKILVVDMTHGGIILASEFSKKQNCEVFAWDIYHTLSDEDKSILKARQIKLVNESFYENFANEKLLRSREKHELMIVAPVHCNLPYPVDMTHHEAVGYLMKNHIDVPVIEITGVKGKTTTAAMLKEIYLDHNPLILSSLGVAVVVGGEEFILQKNISITPASIIKAWNLAEKFFKDHKSFKEEQIDHVGICIFESSLGGTGLADVGVITNIAEDYPIAQGNSHASQAKTQMFASAMVICDYNSYKSIYSRNPTYKSLLLGKKINTYSIDGKSRVKTSNVVYGLDKTTFRVEVNDLQTLDGYCINTSFNVSTFAPAEYHLENTLSAITSALTMGTPIESITQGLQNFRGLPGRTSLRNNIPDKNFSYNAMPSKSLLNSNKLSSKRQGITIIEEINPGINVTAIKKAVTMIKDYEKPAMVLGGSYGVTCEEINEESLLQFLSTLDNDFIMVLTGDLGRSLSDKMRIESLYHDQISQAVNLAVNKGARNILLVYRSNFADLNKR
jgi:coenzyme F430 synthetase